MLVVLVFIIRGLNHRPHYEIYRASSAYVEYTKKGMAKSLSEFVPAFERLTHNPEDYLRYDSNV
jgi:hypothetical protein